MAQCCSAVGQLQQIPHLDVLIFAIAIDRETRGGEARWAEMDRRVTRKAEAFARDAGERIEFRIVVFVVDHRDRVIAQRQAVEVTCVALKTG